MFCNLLEKSGYYKLDQDLKYNTLQSHTLFGYNTRAFTQNYAYADHLSSCLIVLVLKALKALDKKFPSI